MTTRHCSIALLMVSALAASVVFGPSPATAAAVTNVTTPGTGHCDVQKDLVITQSLGEPQRDGSAMYRVDVVNRCDGGGAGQTCAIWAIHLLCGNFRSVTPVDPNVLRVVSPGDCLLINGDRIQQNKNVSFVYTSYMLQRLLVTSATCGRGF